MNSTDLREAARILVAARSAGGAIAPISSIWPDISPADGYAIQRLCVDGWKHEGVRQIGYKILLSRADLQARFETSEPAFGCLLGDMVLANGAAASVRRQVIARAEPEVAVILARDVDDKHCTPAAALEAVDHLVAALELPQGHMDWGFRLGNVLADNGGACVVVLGEAQFSPQSVDLAHLGVVLYRNGVQIERGNTESVLGHPAQALAWLARRLAEQGTCLRAGDLVMTGACSPSLTAQPGDFVEAQFEVLGSVSVRFV